MSLKKYRYIIECCNSIDIKRGKRNCLEKLSLLFAIEWGAGKHVYLRVTFSLLFLSHLIIALKEQFVFTAKQGHNGRGCIQQKSAIAAYCAATAGCVPAGSPEGLDTA